MHRAVEPPFVAGIAPWPDDAESPVCLMIDDFTDGWIDEDGSGRPLGRNDWGAGLDAPGSSFRFLADGLLSEFPEIRTTFFVPVARVEDVRPPRFPLAFRPIDERPEFVAFLRRLDADPRFELAYHGKEHGRPGPSASDYLPEFELYGSVAEAVSALRAGEQIWKGALGRRPEGGKYPAYATGLHGDEAVDVAGYTWWCRQWDAGLASGDDPVLGAPRFFGPSGVVDLPSTVNGGALTLPPLIRTPRHQLEDWIGMRLLGRRRLDAQLDRLLAARAVISVQEHITSSRPDGDTQRPNLYDDVASLRHVFARLRTRRVWHATCGEIVAYFRSREATRVRALSGGRLEVQRTPGEPSHAPLSLILRGPRLADAFALHGPEGAVAVRVSRRVGDTCVTAPVRLAAGVHRLGA